jgi:hypothetical protein
MNKPITEKDIVNLGDHDDEITGGRWLSVDKIIGAKRLLKQRIWERWQDEGLQTDFDEEIDACFQIDDGDETNV